MNLIKMHKQYSGDSEFVKYILINAIKNYRAVKGEGALAYDEQILIVIVFLPKQGSTYDCCWHHH